MDQLVYWIWLSLACTPGTVTFANLISKFSDAEEIYNAPDRKIRTAIDPKISDCSALYNKDLERAEKIYDFCTSKNVGITTYNDPDYPKLLKRIADPPVLLYYRGKMQDWENGFRCAMVGTRKLSSYGRKVAFSLGYDFACVGGTVVSGMAKGIDSVALAAALAAGGKTIAVLGSGIDVCYPKEHLTLAREIVKEGCIFTEFPPGTPPDRWNFPRRNRIISGLCEATVVIEAGEGSGASITGRLAMEQKRQVFAVPALADKGETVGTNFLIKSGARVCTGIFDLIEDFVFPHPIPPTVLDVRNIEEKPRVTIMETLSKYKVVANTNDDDIYVPSGSRKKAPEVTPIIKTPKEMKAIRELENRTEPPTPRPLPKEKKKHPEVPLGLPELVLYQRIPEYGDIAIEDLVDDEFDLGDIMNLLLRLELGRFVVLLPGDRVIRRINYKPN